MLTEDHFFFLPSCCVNSLFDAILNDGRRGRIELSGLDFRIEALERGHPKNLKYQERKSCYYSLLKIHIINVPYLRI